jgi:hypothetical protein
MEDFGNESTLSAWNLTHVNTINKQTHDFWQLGENIAIIGIWKGFHHIISNFLDYYFLDLTNVGCASCLHLEDEFTDPEKLRVKGRISSEWQLLCMNKVFRRASDPWILRVKDGKLSWMPIYTWENFIMTIKMARLIQYKTKGPCRFVQTNCDLNNSECTQRECKFGWESRSQWNWRVVFCTDEIWNFSTHKK